MIFDKAKYHSDGDFPKDLPKSQAFVPTGLFVAWLVENNLLTDEVRADFDEDLANLIDRRTSPSTFYRIIGGVLDDDLLTEEGTQFTTAYFDFDNGKYLDDFHDTLASSKRSLFHVEDTWNNYDRLAKRITGRFRTWKQRRRP